MKKTKKLRTPRQEVQAIARVIGSLRVVTALDNGIHQGFLTSSILQATFSPPGIMIAVKQGQWNESQLEVGHQFVLNSLTEGRTVRRHWCKRSPLHSFKKGILLLNPIVKWAC